MQGTNPDDKISDDRARINNHFMLLQLYAMKSLIIQDTKNVEFDLPCIGEKCLTE